MGKIAGIWLIPADLCLVPGLHEVRQDEGLPAAYSEAWLDVWIIHWDL